MQQQIVIDIPPEIYVTPEIIEDVKELVRDEIFSEMVTKDGARGYENLIERFVTEDEKPVDNIFSAKQQKILTRSLYASWQPISSDGEPRQFFAEANIGLYAKFDARLKPIVPDVLVSLDVTAPENPHEKRHRSYMIWEFGKPPELVVEIVSNEKGDELGKKINHYARVGVGYYVVFDPARFLSADVLRVYEKNPANGYRRREDFDLPGMQLSLTLWEGEFEEVKDTWLRWRDSEGNLLLTGKERADKEALRAEQLAAKLRELGVNPNEI